MNQMHKVYCIAWCSQTNKQYKYTGDTTSRPECNMMQKWKQRIQF